MNETARQRRRWPIVVACLALVIAGLLIGAWNITLPYYAFSPGPVGDALEAIKASEVETYRANEELLMLTVSSQEVNPIEAFLAGIDPTVDLVAREAVRRPDETDEEFVTRNQASMDLSKETAITLALRRLGYEVATTSEGVLIADVDETAPAIDVLRVDDVIVAVEGVAVSLPEDIGTAISDNEPGDLITLDLKRDDQDLTAQVELVAREDDPNAPLIGISVAALEPRFEFPFPIDIDAGLIGGPSAGMMYTLAVMELLGPESLSSGHVIAGTGTIDVDGNVGGIGGVRQKVVAAEAAGAEVMLVPASNYDEALTAPINGIELIPVATLDEVLAALANL
ncbi:MAG TPA: PDZ domain-containing protein [Acidimicrobiia bacterium]|nr:PDZ domain-containing protein [Acidimicrobiia bacterium]